MRRFDDGEAGAEPAAESRRERGPGKRTLTDDLRPRERGEPLPGGLRTELEPALGADLGSVRLHTGAAAAASAEALGARAYTVGQDVSFGAGQYSPGSDAGRRLIAHEVAHTVQQRGADGVQRAPLEVSTPGDALEREAEAFASSFGSAEPHRVSAVSAGVLSRALIQREEATPAPAAQEPVCSETNRAPVEHTVRNAMAAAERSLTSAAEQVPILEEVINQFIRAATLNQDEQAAFEEQHHNLMKGIRAKGKPDLFRMLLDIAVGVVEVATGVGAVVLAVKAAGLLKAAIAGDKVADLAKAGRDLAKASNDTVKGGNDIVKGGDRVGKQLGGGKDTEVEERLAAAVAEVNRRANRLGGMLAQTLALLGTKTEKDISAHMRECAGQLFSVGDAFVTAAACGPEYPAEFRAGIATRADGVEAGLGAVNARVEPIRNLLQARSYSGEDKHLRSGSQPRSLLDFMNQRAADGTLGDFVMRTPREVIELTDFSWEVEAPFGAFSVVQSRDIEELGCRLDGGARWAGALEALGCDKHPYLSDPQHPYERLVPDKQLFHGLNAFDLRRERPQIIRAHLPDRRVIEIVGTAAPFWDNPGFAALYRRDLVVPGGGRLLGISLPGRGSGGTVQPRWLTR